MFNAEISIYVACLASYNNGILHGKWIDITLGEKHIRDEINKMLEESPIPDAEEYAIHDHAGFYSMRLEEYTSIKKIVDIAGIIIEHGELGAEVLNYFGNDIEDAKNLLEDNYLGAYDSELEFAEQLIEGELSTLPAHICMYFDYESFAYDLFLSDYLGFKVDGVVHVFSR